MKTEKPTQKHQFIPSENTALTNSPLAAELFKACGWKVELLKPRRRKK
jgi:hypothetical protein